MRTALITGITGQDGSYLAELLLEKGYKVHGILRRSSSFNTERIQHLYQDPHVKEQRLFLHYADMTDAASILRVVYHVQPNEIYNLAAQSHVGVSFKVPDYTTHVDAIGTLHILESIRDSKHTVRFYQASSSELYGKVMEVPQTETTPFYPRSPYACAKAYAFYITRNYREAYGLFASNGILFNHESPRRNPTFVTRKITRGIARIVLGLEECVYLGNLEARRDWGYAKDYVEGMWRILQHNCPDDFVLATGEMHSVREFIEEVCAYFEIALAWQGQGVDECGINMQTGQKIIQIDPQYFRPSEVDLLIGDASKAQRELLWETRVSFQELVRLMCKADFENEAKLCP